MNANAMRRGVTLLALLVAGSVRAELPRYDFQLQARTNLLGNDSGAYNVAPGNLLGGSYTLPITSDRRVAFTLSITPEQRRGLWYGVEGKGSRVYLLPDLGEDALMGDPSIDSRGNVAFAVTNASSAANNGIYLLNVDDPTRVTTLREPLGATSWSSLVLNEAGQLGARVAVGSGYAYVLYTPGDGGYTAKVLATDVSAGSGPYTFLYSPNLNDRGELAAVVDTETASSEWYQELRVWSSDGSSRLIARSRGLDKESPIYRFASVQTAPNNKGQIVFLATVRTPENRSLTTLFFWNGEALVRVAQDGVGDIKQLEFFPPDLNDQGLFVFRAFRTDGFRAVWVSDGKEIRPVVVEHDLLPSDLGQARVDQETPSSPVFGGSPSINARGDITFAPGLAPPDNDQEEWGTAVYVAQAQTDGSDAGVDAGTEPDAGGGTDGGGADAGTEPDAGGGLDGGAADAGTEPDAGGEVDGGGCDPDAGGVGCEPDGGGDGDGGDTVDSGTEPGTDDAGTQPDGGSRPDAGPTDGGTFDPLPGDGDDGCGCQSTSPAALWPWALVGLVGLARRRARSGGPLSSSGTDAPDAARPGSMWS